MKTYMLAESKKINEILHFHYQEIFILKTLDILVHTQKSNSIDIQQLFV